MTTPADPSVPRSKGSNILGILYAIQQMFGVEVQQRVITGLPPDLIAAINSGTLMMSGWYPLEWYKAQHRIVQQVTGHGHDLATELACIFVTHQLDGVYKALLKVISPHWLFQFPSVLFKRYFETGALKVVECREGFVRGRWSGCVGFDRNIWNAVWGGCRAALQRAGAKDVMTDVVAGGGDGEDNAEASARWH